MAWKAKSDNGTMRYVVLPEYGFKSPIIAQSQKLRAVGQSVQLAARPAEAAARRMRVLHSLHEDGPKLVQMSPQAELELRAEIGGLKVVPVVYYQPARRGQPSAERKAKPQAVSVAKSDTVRISVRAKGGGPMVAGAQVVAFTDFRSREGAEGRTNASGTATIQLKVGTNLERLYVFPSSGYWSRLERGVTLSKSMQTSLADRFVAVQLAAADLREPLFRGWHRSCGRRRRHGY